jgi:hypothetical protein
MKEKIFYLNIYGPREDVIVLGLAKTSVAKY